jgi:hypothetical protein
MSTECKLGLLVVQGAWLPTTACLLLDLLGKGSQTAPRDTLITLIRPGSRRAGAFGVHRAFASAGVSLGPLIAYSLLSFFPDHFQGFSGLSLGMGLLSLATLVLSSGVGGSSWGVIGISGGYMSSLYCYHWGRSCSWAAWCPWAPTMHPTTVCSQR